MPELRGEPLVDVTRDGLVESTHRVAACAIDAHGKVAIELGEIDVPVFLRSTAKPFIAAAVLEAGVAQAFGFESHEIALIAGSHSGEPFHLAAVRSMLAKIGVSETALQCGAQLPYSESAAQALMRAGEAPSAVYNNCSGKHAGILALCKVMGADTQTYLEPANPAQAHILAFCARLCDEDPATWPLGVDGCGIPTFATTLRRGALAFLRFATLRDLADRDAQALRAIRDAMIAHPKYVAGTSEFDTELMRAGAGAIVCKAGAEGVHGVAAIGASIGYASKVVDGGARGRAPATVEALRALGAIRDGAVAKLASFARPKVYNRAGRTVGEVRCRTISL